MIKVALENFVCGILLTFFLLGVLLFGLMFVGGLLEFFGFLIVR